MGRLRGRTGGRRAARRCANGLLPHDSQGRVGPGHRTPRQEGRHRNQVQRGTQAGPWLLAVVEGPADRHRLGRGARDAPLPVGALRGRDTATRIARFHGFAGLARPRQSHAAKCLTSLPREGPHRGGRLPLAPMGICKRGSVATEQQLLPRDGALAFSSVQSSSSEMYDASIVELVSAEGPFGPTSTLEITVSRAQVLQEWHALWSFCIENGFSGQQLGA